MGRYHTQPQCNVTHPQYNVATDISATCSICNVICGGIFFSFFPLFEITVQIKKLPRGPPSHIFLEGEGGPGVTSLFEPNNQIAPVAKNVPSFRTLLHSADVILGQWRKN